MPASLLVAAPDSTTRMRQAADLVVDPAAGDPAAQINALTKGRRGVCDWAAGTYPVRSQVLRRTALEHVGEGAASRVVATGPFTGDRVFGTEAAAHYTIVRGFHIDCARVAKYAAYSDSGKPDAALPQTSPDAWHRHDHLVVTGATGPAFGSQSGTEGTREGWFRNVLIIGSGFEWGGSDVWIDNLEVRNNPTPVTISGGNARAGASGIKVFYAEASVAFRVSSSRFIGVLVEVQDAAAQSVVIDGADCNIAQLRVDTGGRRSLADAVTLNGARPMLTVQVIDRGANAGAPGTRHGVVVNAASGGVVDALVGPGLSGQAYAGSGVSAMASLRVNGKRVVGDQAEPPSLGAVTQSVAELQAAVAALAGRVATIEGGAVNTQTSLAALDDAITALDAAVGSLDAVPAAIAALATRVAVLEQRAAAAAATLPALDAAVAAIKANAPQMRIAMEHASRTLRAGYGA